MGPTENSLIVSLTVPGLVRRAGDVPLGRWLWCCGDLVYSAGGGSPHPVAHVEAPDLDIIMRRSLTSENHYPTDDFKKELDIQPQLKGRITI